MTATGRPPAPPSRAAPDAGSPGPARRDQTGHPWAYGNDRPPRPKATVIATIPVTRTVSIDESELEFSFARSSGAGGQHVNTSSTKVELRWDVASSAALTPEQRELVRARLGNRVTADGVLILQSSEHRSQARNREAAVKRLQSLVADALHVRASRRPTKPTRAARRRRLDAKRRRSETKTLRQRPPTE